MRDSAIASFDAAVCRFAPAKTGNRLDGTGCRSTYFWAPAPEAAGNTGTLCSLFDFFAYMEKKNHDGFCRTTTRKIGDTTETVCMCIPAVIVVHSGFADLQSPGFSSTVAHAVRRLNGHVFFPPPSSLAANKTRSSAHLPESKKVCNSCPGVKKGK